MARWTYNKGQAAIRDLKIKEKQEEIDSVFFEQGGI
jgi:hypothetical protein